MPAYISIVCMCKSIHIIIGAHTNEQRYCLAKTNHICIYMYIYIYIKQTIYKQYIYIYIYGSMGSCMQNNYIYVRNKISSIGLFISIQNVAKQVFQRVYRRKSLRQTNPYMRLYSHTAECLQVKYERMIDIIYMSSSII